MSTKFGILRILTVHCDEITRLVSMSLDTDLSRPERIAVRIHLLYCTSCRRFRKHMSVLREILKRAAANGEDAGVLLSQALSAEARARIQRALDAVE